MADWIKVEITSSQKIEVLTIADILDIDEHMVFGKLVILWCWADANTVDGHADNVTKRMVDRVVSHKGFADALLDTRVGWLKEDEKDGVFFPNFDRHNGKGAKKRATDARRKASHRAVVANKSEGCHTESVTDTVTREEKIREDKKKSNKFTPPSADDAQSYFEERGFGEKGVGQRFVDHYSASGWMRGKNKIKDWKACVRTWCGNMKPVIKTTPQQEITAEQEADRKRKADEEFAAMFNQMGNKR